MKIDRLIAITMYLLNRDVVSASQLAENFEVSKRTIQRDIDTLNLAGIPISATYGSEGGYEILDGFRLEKGIVGVEDYVNIITALKGMSSAYESGKVDETLEKVVALSKAKKQSVYLDLSVAQEGIEQEDFRQMEAAVREGRPMRMTYAGGNGDISKRVIEPLALTYQWYGWYLLAYCREKEDYRLFKVVRIKSFEVLDGHFRRDHGEIGRLLERQSQDGFGECYNILLRCRNGVREQVEEYLKGQAEAAGEEFFLFRMVRPVHERMWFSLVLGFGEAVEVLEPPELRERIRDHIASMNKIYP